jgi:o-succinylbenzoate---CoA ligase
MRALVCSTEQDPAQLEAFLHTAWCQGRVVGLAAAAERARLRAALGEDGAGNALADFGPGVVVGSGGSTGGRKWCLQPLAHLEASAAASGRWLTALGIDPSTCLHLNPLPLHHVSGLLPLVRCRQWGAQLGWLPPALLRQPQRLAQAVPLPAGRPVLLSLVPTQLGRLLASREGIAWLAGCAVIWVGGAALPPDLAAIARAAGLALSPCYGATETAAMVCALPPQRFLAATPGSTPGSSTGCGDPLDDVALRIDPATAALEVRTQRLSPGWLEAGRLQPLPLAPGGWWRSGDGGRLGPAGLELLGRLDGAILSGGETVFPEQIEARLRAEAAGSGLALEAVLLLAEADPEWGERLVALVRARPGADGDALLQALQGLVAGWPAAERPRSWRLCAALAPDAAGKWQRADWRDWLAAGGGGS